MASLAKNHLILCSTTSSSSHRRRSPRTTGKHPPQTATPCLAAAATTELAATAARRPAAPPPAVAEEAAAVRPRAVPRWGARSHFKERLLEPRLTAGEAAARIRQTAEGMRTLRPMLEAMSWKYVLFYVRLKSAHLDTDLPAAMAGVADERRAEYLHVANELVDNMTELDRLVRSPKVTESYLYYEKTLKSLNEVAEFLT